MIADIKVRLTYPYRSMNPGSPGGGSRPYRTVDANQGRLLVGYVIAVSLAGAALPLGGYYLKFDWAGGLLVSLCGLVGFLYRGVNRLALAYCCVYCAYLLLNGLLSVLIYGGGFGASGFISYLFQYVLALSVFLSVVSMRIDEKCVVRVMQAWVVVGCLACVLAVLQKLTNSLLIDGFLFIPYYADNRISNKVVYGVLAPTAWFSEASWFGSFIVVPTVFAAFHLLSPSHPVRKRTLYGLALGLLSTGVVLGYSLTAALSVAVGIGAMIVLAHRARWRLSVLILLGALLLLALSATPLVSLQVQRFAELGKNLADFQAGSEFYGRATSFYVRSVGFYEGFQAFARNPVTGHGLGQSTNAYHSGSITLLAELGLVGAALYFVAPVVAAVGLWRLRKGGSLEQRVLATSLLVCLAADYSNGLVTHHSFNLQRWLLVGIALGWVIAAITPSEVLRRVTRHRTESLPIVTEQGG